jgi:DIM1 family U5 snRNP protein
MGSVFLNNLRTGWHVDQAILSEDDRLVVIRFGDATSRECLLMDELLYKIAPLVSQYAAIYTCDTTVVTDFNEMYELFDPMCVMFFHRNKHMLCDFGTGNNNKMDFVVQDKQELIDIIECIYRGASKGKGLVMSPRDYSYIMKGVE